MRTKGPRNERLLLISGNDDDINPLYIDTVNHFGDANTLVLWF